MEATTAGNDVFSGPVSDDDEQDIFSTPTLGEMDTLPCGYVEGGQLFRNITIEEITGVDEDTLANEKLARDGSNFDKVMANTISQLGPIENPMDPATGVRKNNRKMEEALRKLRVGDRYFILLKLRSVSLGPMFEAQVTCPRCSASNEMGVNIDNLLVHPMSEDDALQEEFLGKTDNDTFKFRVLTGAGEKMLQRVRKEKKDALITGFLFLKLTELNGAKPDMKRLKMMSSQRRNAIRKEMLRVEGGIETELDARCDECGNGWRMELPIGQKGFFFPSGI